MKKLIALLICCLFALVGFTKEPLIQQNPSTNNNASIRLGARVAQATREAVQKGEQNRKLEEANARMVTVALTVNNFEEKGQAIIVKFTDNYTNAILIATESFTYDELLDEPQVRGQLKGGVVFSNKDGFVKDAEWLRQYELSKFTVPCKLEGTQLEKAKKIAPISVDEAASLAKAVQKAEEQKWEEYRKGIIILPRKK